MGKLRSMFATGGQLAMPRDLTPTRLRDAFQQPASTMPPLAMSGVLANVDRELDAEAQVLRQRNKSPLFRAAAEIRDLRVEHAFKMAEDLHSMVGAEVLDSPEKIVRLLNRWAIQLMQHDGA